MKLRNPLIALGVLAGLSAYVYIVEIKGGERKQKEKEAAERVFSLKAGDVTGFTLARRGERVRLQKAAGKWRIEEPLSGDSDADAVERLVGSLESLRISHDLGKQSDLGPFNLKDPAIRLEVQAIGRTAPPSLSLGDDAPTGGGTYARVDDSDKVLIVTGASTLQGASLYSLRDKTFLKFDPARLTGCRIIRGKEEVDLARSEGKWHLSAPVSAPADDSTVSDLLFALERLTVGEFLDRVPTADLLGSRGLRPPATRVVLTGEEWKGEKDLAFGNAEGGNLYALHPGTGSLVRVPDSIEAKLKSSPADLRKKDILPFSRYDISRLRITGIGATPLELERKSDKEWNRVSPSPGTLGDDPVDLLLRNLSDLKADSFVDDPGKDLGRYGLGPAAIRIEFWKKDQEKGQPAVVEIGRTDAKGKIPMRDPAWTPLLMVPAGPWDQAREQALKVGEEKPVPPAAAPQTAPSAPSGSAKTPSPKG